MGIIGSKGLGCGELIDWARKVSWGSVMEKGFSCGRL